LRQSFISLKSRRKKVEPLKESGEVSLIPAIQALVNKGGRVYALELQPEEKRIDIGNAEKYREALNITYKYYSASEIR